MKASAGVGGWWDAAFGPLYPVVYCHRDDDEAQRDVAAAVRLLDAKPGAPLLDLCCGDGRHAVLMQRDGLAVTGLDLSATLLVHASRRGLQRLVRGDQRRLPFRNGAFAFVTSFFTSFGYLPTDAENEAVLAEIARVLQPGGRFLLDVPDADHVARDLTPADERRVGDLVVRSTRRLVDHRVEKRVQVVRDDGTPVAAWEESVRLYDAAELTTMLARQGFVDLARAGSFDGHPAGCGSRQIVLSERRS